MKLNRIRHESSHQDIKIALTLLDLLFFDKDHFFDKVHNLGFQHNCTTEKVHNIGNQVKRLCAHLLKPFVSNANTSNEQIVSFKYGIYDFGNATPLKFRTSEKKFDLSFYKPSFLSALLNKLDELKC